MEKKIDVSDLRGALVVAFEEGLRLGKVADVYFDQQTKQIIGISLRKSLAIGKESFVYSRDIRKLGIDVIIVSGEKNVQPLSEAISEMGLKRMEELVVTTDDGNHIGQITALNVSEDEWKISGLILDKKKMLEIEVDDITIGKDVIIVPSEYMARVKEVGKEKTGIMRRLMDTEHIGETAKGTVQSVGETVKKTTGKIEDTVKETTQKMGEAIKTTSEKMEDTVRKTLKTSKPETKKTEERADQKTPEGELKRQPKNGD